MSSILTGLRAVSLATKFSAAVAPLVALGPWGIVVAIGKGIVAGVVGLVKMLFEDVQFVFTKPHMWALVAAVFALGLHFGIRHDANMVDDANAVVTTIKTEAKAAQNADAVKIKQAIAARDAAKNAPTPFPTVVIPATVANCGPPAAPAGKPKPTSGAGGVRNKPKPTADSSSWPFSLSAF